VQVELGGAARFEKKGKKNNAEGGTRDNGVRWRGTLRECVKQTEKARLGGFRKMRTPVTSESVAADLVDIPKRGQRGARDRGCDQGGSAFSAVWGGV